MSLLKSTQVKLGRAHQLALAENLVDWMGNGIAVAGTVDPQSVAGGATVLTDAVDSRLFKYLMFVLKLGATDATVDFKLTQSATAGGAYTDVTGKAATQMDGTTDNTQKVIIVKQSELDADKPFVKGEFEAAAGATAALMDVTVLGVGPLASPVADVDLASVSEIVGQSTYQGGLCRFYTDASDVPTKDSVPGDLTFAALGGAGISLNAWDGPIALPNGGNAMHHDVSAIAGPAPTNETLAGLVVLDAAGTQILHWEPFAEEVAIAHEGDSLIYEIVVPLADTLFTGLTN